ncbi:hypothetical protein ACVWYH_000184 [Bradyrhizobium sp. GM24.11]
MTDTTVNPQSLPAGFVLAPQLPEILRPVIIRRGFIGFLRGHPTVAIGGALLLALVLIAIFAPYLGTVDPTALAPAKRTRAPSAAFWFGSDVLGRDIYSRVLFGARVSLTVGLSVAILASAAGLAIGIVSGFIRWADGILMRFMDGLMSIPPILLAIALMALTRGSVGNVILAITIAEIPRVSRLVRSVVLSLREQPYVDAAGRLRHAYADDYFSPYPAQYARADAGAGDLHLRQRHDHGGDPVLYRRRYAAHHSVLGQHHGRGPRAVAGQALYRVLPGGLPLRHRARREPARRRPSRCARSAHGQEPVMSRG